MVWRFWRKPNYIAVAATHDDPPVLAEIHEASFPHGWDVDALDRMLDADGMIALIARREDGDTSPVGFVLARSTGEEAEIITIATDPAVRGRGIGRLLMEEAIRRLQHDRVPRLFLEVSERNAAALALYRSLGFRKVGERKGYYASHAPSISDRTREASGAPPATPPAALVMERVLR